jgi:hypothetical protein
MALPAPSPPLNREAARPALHVRQDMIPNSRSKERGSSWRAESTIDGVVYEAPSRSGAAYALARVLVAAGIPDGPVTTGRMSWPSLHRMAERTISESAKSPLHSAVYREFDWGG